MGFGGMSGYGDGLGGGINGGIKARPRIRRINLISRPNDDGRTKTTKFSSPKRTTFGISNKRQEQLRPKHIPKRTFDKLSPRAKENTMNSIAKNLKLRDLTPRQQSDFKDFAERKHKKMDLVRHRTPNNFGGSLDGNTFREYKNNIFGLNIPNHNVERVKKRIKKAKSDKLDNDLFGIGADFNFF